MVRVKVWAYIYTRQTSRFDVRSYCPGESDLHDRLVGESHYLRK
jgi:hypothetical protein